MKTRHLTILLNSIAVVALGICTQLTQAYRLFAKEVENPWLNDQAWITGHLAQPGGVAQLLTSALTQCYAIPLVGALAFTVISAIIVVSLHSFSWRRHTLSLCLLPPVFLFLSHESSFYSLRGDVALMLAVAIAAACNAIRVRNGVVMALLSAVGTALAYWCAGSAAVVTAVLLVVMACIRREWLAVVLPPLALLGMAAVAVHTGHYASWQYAITPLQYYEWPSTYFFQIYAWSSAVLAVLADVLYSHTKMPERWRYVLPVICLVAIGAMGMNMYGAVHSVKNYMLRQEEWMAQQRDWQGIIQLREHSDEKTCFVSYLNLALAETGQLTERLFEFRPYVVSIDEVMDDDGAGFQSDGATGASRQRKTPADTAGSDSIADRQVCSPLLMKSDELSRDGQKVQSAVMYEWGGAALCNAQKAAFETNMLTPGCCDAAELKRLVVTNAVFETPLVAEKYLRRLQRTTFHKAWADSVIANRVAFDKTVAAIRRTLPKDNTLYMKTQIVKTLQSITETDPANEVAAQFYEAYLLLTIDRTGLREWAEKRHASGKKLSTLLQQALIYCIPKGMERDAWLKTCRTLGVSDTVIEQEKNWKNESEKYQNSFWQYMGNYYIG